MVSGTKPRARHLLNRLTYGIRPGELESLAAGGEKSIKAWLDAQLDPDSISDPGLAIELAHLPSLKMSSMQIAEHYHHLSELLRRDGVPLDRAGDPGTLAKYSERLIDRVGDELRTQRLFLAVHAKAQLRELLFEFWFNHFNVEYEKFPVKWGITSFDRDAIRPHLFGEFRDLLEATAHHPAMLEYLDNTSSRLTGPGGRGVNENYARELMELHTVGVDGGYDQKDIIALARILTGWTDAETYVRPVFAFREDLHDREMKTFLGNEYSGSEGVREGERAIDFLARHKSTANFLSRKLVRFFVSDTPPESLVKKVARRFDETHGNLREVYRTLFESEEFWSESALSGKTKRPFQFLVSALRALDAKVNPDVQAIGPIDAILTDMGEPMFSCGSPTGYPDDPRYWIAPGAMVLRIRTSIALSQGKIHGVSVPSSPAGRGERPTAKLIEAEARKVLNAEPSKALKKRILLRCAGAADAAETPDLIPWVRALALASPEFQRR